MAANDSVPDKLEGVASRPVFVITTPVKAKGNVASLTINLLRIVSRSKLVWSTHWTIRVGSDSFFELQRVPQQPQPILRYSRSFAGRQQDVISEHLIGSTRFTDAQILQKGDEHFARNSDLWYDIFINSCQIFVYQILEDLSAGNSTSRITGVAFTLTRITAFAPMLCTRLYLARAGCQNPTIGDYCQMQYLYVFYLWSRLFVSINQFREVLFSSKRGRATPVLDAVKNVYLLTVWVPIYFWSTLKQAPIISCVDNRWTITRPFDVDAGSKTSSPVDTHVPILVRVSCGSITALFGIAALSLLFLRFIIQKLSFC